jgi:apolipoprotein N-acyltransferase
MWLALRLSRYLKSRTGTTRIGLAVASGVLITFAFPRFELWPLVWVSFVPALFAVRRAGPLESAALGGILGTVWCFATCPWLIHTVEAFVGLPAPLSWVVALGMAMWCGGAATGLAIGLFRFAQRATGVTTLVLLPLSWMMVWPVFPNPFFVTLGTGSLSALFTVQGADIFGTYTLDAVILLSSAAIFEALTRPRELAQRVAIVAAFAVVAAWWGYGAVVGSSWQDRVDGWSAKKIGLLQPNRESSFKRLRPEPGYSRDFPFEMEMSQELAQQGADLIVWPEGHLYGTVTKASLRSLFGEHIRRMGVDVIIHDKGADPDKGWKVQRNTSMFYPTSGEAPQLYYKRKLVPFGEYYPVVGYDEELRKSLGLPMSIWPGTEKTTFEAGGMRVDPLICYEIMFPRHVADAVGDDAAGKVLLVQSNDGWYGPGTAPAHHRAATILRAIENRVPIIHVLNNGESHIIGPHGVTHFLAPAEQRGKWLAEMPYDAKSGGSFYSRHPGWCVWFARMLSVVGLAAFFVRRRRRTADAAV